MHLDVLDLRAFYYRTKLGRAAQRTLQDALRALWPETRDLLVIGFGFAAPMLRPFLADARRVVALMPAQQGVMPWPVGAANVSALVEETRWPIETDSVDRLIVAHGIETCDQPGALLDEIWRTLAPGGRAVFIVPNRSGLWAQRELTPFGFGRPYSLGQMKALLGRHGLAPERHASALYAPPSHRRFWLQTAQVWEHVGRRFDPHLVAGVLLVEVTKEVRALPRKGAKASILDRLEALEGLRRPSPEPAASRREHGAEARRSALERGAFPVPQPYCHPFVPLLSPPRFHPDVKLQGDAARSRKGRGAETEGRPWRILDP